MYVLCGTIYKKNKHKKRSMFCLVDVLLLIIKHFKNITGISDKTGSICETDNIANVV